MTRTRPIADIVSGDARNNERCAASTSRRRDVAIGLAAANGRSGYRAASGSISRSSCRIPGKPDTSVFYFITVSGQTPAIYHMDQPPNIVVHEGDVEDWMVENRAPEDHAFHIHQIHFRVLEVDGKPVNDGTVRDTIDPPYWSGVGPYPQR